MFVVIVLDLIVPKQYQCKRMCEHHQCHTISHLRLDCPEDLIVQLLYHLRHQYFLEVLVGR